MSPIDAPTPRSRSVFRALPGLLLPGLGAGVLAAVGCGSSTDEQVGARYDIANQLAQATSYGGQATGQAGAAGAPSGGSGGAAGAAVTPPPPPPPPAPDAPSGPPQECNGPNIANGVFGTPAPSNGLLIDFATYTARTATGGGAWGDTGRGQITGGTSVYSGTPESALTITAENGELHLTATMAAMGDYTGIVLWFTPCVNATAFAGLTFPMSGELGGSRLLVKPQTSPDYPVDVANTKGKCPFESEATKFDSCAQPTATLDELAENPITLTWPEFVGGAPVAATDPAQLLGFELQFQCQATDGGCALDVRVGKVDFLPPG
jgi:hypothetical protein